LDCVEDNDTVGAVLSVIIVVFCVKLPKAIPTELIFALAASHKLTPSGAHNHHVTVRALFRAE
jgi:hypothetical protein